MLGRAGIHPVGWARIPGLLTGLLRAAGENSKSSSQQRVLSNSASDQDLLVPPHSTQSWPAWCGTDGVLRRQVRHQLAVTSCAGGAYSSVYFLNQQQPCSAAAPAGRIHGFGNQVDTRGVPVPIVPGESLWERASHPYTRGSGHPKVLVSRVTRFHWCSW